MSQIAKLFPFWSNIPEREAQRGMGASLIASIISFVIGYLFQRVGTEPTASYLLLDLLLGNFIGFVFDTFLASKESFCIPRPNKGKCPEFLRSVEIKDLKNILGADPNRRWILLSRLASTAFIAFWVTVIFDTLISVPLFDEARILMDKAGFMTGEDPDCPSTIQIVRNAILRVVIAGVTFFIYANLFRFNWAYKTPDDPTRFSDTFVLGLVLLLAIFYWLLVPEDGESTLRTNFGKNLLVFGSVGLVGFYVVLRVLSRFINIRNKFTIPLIAFILTFAIVGGTVSSAAALRDPEVEKQC